MLMEKKNKKQMLKYPNFFKSFSLMTASIEIHSHALLNKAVKFFLLNSKGFVCLFA